MVEYSDDASNWRPTPRATMRVVAVCFLAVLFEGYDVGVMGAVIPTIAIDRTWHLTPLELGALSSYALLGMFFGAMLIGTLSETIGRRRMLLVCVSLFSLSMVGAASAPSPGIFGLMRLIGGFGLGGVIPVAAALTIEFSPHDRRAFNYGLMYSGYSIGITCAALLSIFLLKWFGWRTVIGIGVAPLILTPLMAAILPESIENLIGKGRIKEANELADKFGTGHLSICASLDNGSRRITARDVLGDIFCPTHLRATICFWSSLFFGLLLVYGLNTWLPSIMRKNGYDLGSSLTFLVVFSSASAVGGLFMGKIADRFGTRRTVASFYLLGAASILGLMRNNSVLVNYSLVALAGVGTVSASLILTGYVAGYYPAQSRAAATGWALSFARIGAVIGPLLGGYVAGTDLPLVWNFLVFALAGVIASFAVMLLPERNRKDEPSKFFKEEVI